MYSLSGAAGRALSYGSSGMSLAGKTRWEVRHNEEDCWTSKHCKMTFRSNKKSLFTMLSVHLVWCSSGSNETEYWLLETGRCPSSLKQRAYSSPAVRAFAKSNKCLIHFKRPIFSVRQGPVTAVALQPFQWNKVTALGSMAGKMCRQALTVVATFPMSCQDYMVRLFPLPWRQGMARILFIIQSLAAGGRHCLSPRVLCLSSLWKEARGKMEMARYNGGKCYKQDF